MPSMETIFFPIQMHEIKFSMAGLRYLISYICQITRQWSIINLYKRESVHLHWPLTV